MSQGLRTVPFNRGRTATVKCHFKLSTKSLPMWDDDGVNMVQSVTYELRSTDAFTADGVGRLNRLIREKIGDVLGDVGPNPWGPSMTISRTYSTQEEYDNACMKVLAFVRQHTHREG